MAQSSFPQNIKTWTDKQDFVDDVMAKDTNEAYAEIIAMQKYIKPVNDTGTANTYKVIIDNVTAYFDGLMVTVKIKNSNTGTSTLDINSLGAKTIKKEKDVGLSANDLKEGQYAVFVYDETSFQLVSSVKGMELHDNEWHDEDYATVEDFNNHLSSTMSHQFKNLQTNKTYQYGFQISENGKPQIVYEEVI